MDVLAETAELIGSAAAARLIEAFGGRGIRVPIRQQGRTWEALVEAIGEDAAAAFCRHYAGETIYIVSKARFDRERCRVLAAKMRAKGRLWSEIARRLGYTERGARKLLEKRPSERIPPNKAYLGVYLGVSRKIGNR